MYVRFIVLAPKPRRALGLFRSDTWLLDDPSLPDWLRHPIEEHRRWFNKNLRVPHSAVSRRRHIRSAICWFKSDARDHIARARDLAWLIAEAGHPTAMIKTHWVGQLIYRDEFQIAAKPDRDTRLAI